MHTEGDEVHVDDTEASGGSKEGVVRWVLVIGTLMAIIVLSLIWMTGAFVHQDTDDQKSSYDQFGAADRRDK